MAAPVVFLDTETTGLDPDVHDVWEIGLIVDEAEVSFRLRPDLKMASPDALRITRYYDRVMDAAWQWSTSRMVVVEELARLTSGRHLVGAVPSFDAAFLTRLLRKYGLQPAWHYHLVDVEALAAGKLGIEPPWDTRKLAAALGIAELPASEVHTALGDARWAKAIYEAVLRA